MEQNVYRYFNEIKNIPNLIIVDGGKAQVHAAKKMLDKLSIKLNVIGLVKNDRHTTNHIIDLKENKIVINNQNLLNFLRGVQSEVDRFAKSFYRKKSIQFSLDQKLNHIKGIGDKTIQKLLNHFKTYSNIYNADLKSLQVIIKDDLAEKIYKEFHNE
jgi:excinuclease ABC subunit C